MLALAMEFSKNAHGHPWALANNRWQFAACGWPEGVATFKATQCAHTTDATDPPVMTATTTA
jgi:hypothetical protein